MCDCAVQISFARRCNQSERIMTANYAVPGRAPKCGRLLELVGSFEEESALVCGREGSLEQRFYVTADQF